MKVFPHTLVPVLLAAALLAPCRADSLFPVGNAASGSPVSLFADNKAHAVGDILTIVINETASAASQAATKTSKADTFSFGPGTGPNIVHIGSFQFGLGSLPALGLNDSSTGNASGSTTRSDNLSAQIEVTVKQVLPNGNLVVEGTRQVGMNAETQSIILTGIVRPQDISSSNTVQSPQVADAQIKYSGKGPVGNQQHDGLIARVFKFLF